MRFVPAAVLAALLAVGLCACGQGAGTAIFNASGLQVGAIAIRPGDEIGFLAVELLNTSHSPLTIQSMRVQGPGIGTVVKLVQEEIGPSTPGKNAAPGSIYRTDPPAMWMNKQDGCHVQALRPVRGFVLRPRRLAWLWEVFKGVRAGQWSVPVHPVTYTQGGAGFREVLKQKDYGTVRTNAQRPPLYWAERWCLALTKPLP